MLLLTDRLRRFWSELLIQASDVFVAHFAVELQFAQQSSPPISDQNHRRQGQCLHQLPRLQTLREINAGSKHQKFRHLNRTLRLPLPVRCPARKQLPQRLARSIIVVRLILQASLHLWCFAVVRRQNTPVR